MIDVNAFFGKCTYGENNLVMILKRSKNSCNAWNNHAHNIFIWSGYVM